MNYGDWIFLAIFLAIAVAGALIGFGRGLKFLTGGIVGVAISIVLCYFFGGMILDIPFVSGLLSDLAAKWSHVSFLVTIRLEIIIYYIALFLLFTLARIIIVSIIKHITDSDVIVIRIFNKIGGVILFVGLAFLLMFFVFQIIHWIGDGTADSFRNLLRNSSNIVVRLYDKNPMKGLVDFVTGK